MYPRLKIDCLVHRSVVALPLTGLTIDLLKEWAL